MSDLIEKAKSFFYSMVSNFGSDPYGLLGHLPLVEQQMKNCLKKFPEANAEIALLGVWLHDIGHYPIPTDIDHAVRGEERTRNFLEENTTNIYIINQICHCVRAHRCRDVQPETLEAKLVAFSDSASHLVDSVYIDMIKKGNGEQVLSKLERDYRDLALIDGMQKEYQPLYEARKQLLTEMQKMYQ